MRIDVHIHHEKSDECVGQKLDEILVLLKSDMATRKELLSIIATLEKSETKLRNATNAQKE